MNSFYKELQGKKQVQILYQSKLDGLTFSYEFVNVETSFGDTNVIVAGNDENPPLVLLHRANECAPIALDALKELVKDFKVYAVDVIGQPNLSAEIRPWMHNDAYGKWMFEILSRLTIQKAILVGISFGALITWKTLLFDERRIKSAFFITPAGIIDSYPISTLWKIFLPLKLFQWLKRPRYIRCLLKELKTEMDEFDFDFFSTVFLNFELDVSPIPSINMVEAQKIKTPIFLIAAEKDVFYPASKLVQKTTEIFPSSKKSMVLEQSKHIPNEEDNQRIVDFIKSNVK
ncbi:MAG: alpha/beta hydrolase [Saprospiraceae bacterium]|nr:alpha/beta hydrolase [Saprospiraceae bacterium]